MGITIITINHCRLNEARLQNDKLLRQLNKDLIVILTIDSNANDS